MQTFNISHEEAQEMSKLLKSMPNREWHLENISGTLEYILKLSERLVHYFGF